MHKWQPIAASIAVIFSILACTMPSSGEISSAATAFAATQTAAAAQLPPGAPPVDTAAVPSATNTAAAAPLPPSACSPLVTANLSANVRAGDSTDYAIVGFLAAAQTAPLMGRNAADTWWYIAYGGSQAWVAKSVVTASCLPASVAVVVPPPLPPTLTPVPVVFAVTGVTYSFSEADYGLSDCPMMTAQITANGAGDVSYVWTRSDNASGSTETVHFNSAGTKSVSTNWQLGPALEGTEHWLGIYVDSPNNQDFGHKTFTDACGG